MVYIGKCEDGAFWHLVVTRFNVHIYRRYHNGRRWVTVRVLAGLDVVAKHLRTLPGRVRSALRDVLSSLRPRLAATSTDTSSARTRDLLRLAVHVMDMVRKVLDYFDMLPDKVRERALRTVRREVEKIREEVARLDVPDSVRYRIQSAVSVYDIVETVELALIEEAERHYA